MVDLKIILQQNWDSPLQRLIIDLKCPKIDLRRKKKGKSMAVSLYFVTKWDGHNITTQLLLKYMHAQKAPKLRRSYKIGGKRFSIGPVFIECKYLGSFCFF